MSPRSRILVAGHRILLRARRPRLRRLVELGYAGIARATSVYLTRGAGDAATYVRGAFGTDDFVPGLSDVDVAIVFARDPANAGAASDRARRRWARLRRVVPPIDLLFDWPRIHDESELAELAGASAYTYGLDNTVERPHEVERTTTRAAYLDDGASLDRVRMLERPGLYGGIADWRLLSGPDHRPAEPGRDAQDRRIAAWLELLYLWRWVFPFCIDPTTPRTTLMSVKLVAEPVRIWLWLAHGERADSRADALERGLRWMPDEEESLRSALELDRALTDSPEPQLAGLLPAAMRLSARIADLIGSEVFEHGTTEVRLVGADPAELILAERGIGSPEEPQSEVDPVVLPLADWRALACPALPDESFAVLSGDPSDPVVLASLATSWSAGPYPALRSHDLMVLPAAPLLRTRLRAIKSPATDPVPFALAQNSPTAAFPEVRGWSAADTARRAVAEHRARLRDQSASRPAGELEDNAHQLATLLTAARAGLFLESVRDGEPELCVTVTETARQLARRSTADRGVAEQALEHYREFALHGAQPPPVTISTMRERVLALPAYA